MARSKRAAKTRPPVTYETVVRGKWMFDGCKTVGEMAERAEKFAAGLREMAADGVTLRGEVEDDYAFLITQDEAAATKHEMQPEGADEEDDWDE